MLTRAYLRRSLDELAGRDKHIARGIELVGYPESRSGQPANFESLLRIIAGQQLSVKAAASIFGRLEQAMNGEIEPQRLQRLSDSDLRELGLSRQKIGYARGLAQAVLDGDLRLESLADLPDEEVIEKLVELKGFGRWSAQMFLLFSLGRPDVWPVDDLGIQAGLHKLKNMRARPDRTRTEAIGRPWRPYRGVAAIFIWHYYSNAPM